VPSLHCESKITETSVQEHPPDVVQEMTVAKPSSLVSFISFCYALQQEHSLRSKAVQLATPSWRSYGRNEDTRVRAVAARHRPTTARAPAARRPTTGSASLASTLWRAGLQYCEGQPLPYPEGEARHCPCADGDGAKRYQDLPEAASFLIAGSITPGSAFKNRLGATQSEKIGNAQRRM